MDLHARFRSISPLDHRYYLANTELFERVADYLSEEAAVRQCVLIEAALLDELVELLLPGTPETEAYREAIARLPERVTPEAVYAEEETTRHNIRAIVNVIQRNVPESIAHLVHLGATSVDILDTAAAVRYRDLCREVILPLLIRVERELITITEREETTVAIGRTHGRHAVPITIGFVVAEYVARLGESIAQIERLCGQLRGKLSGAVGAYNATSLLHRSPEELERRVLARFGLRAGEHATQIVHPEPLLRLLLEINTAFGVIANLADDLRHLQRSEIDEVREHFSSGQVGSSTMPHKRNPWNAEHVKSLWKAFAPRATTWFMDQISEHQRDLSNSASGRFVAEYLAGFCAAAERMRRILERLHFDYERIGANLAEGARQVIAEPLYILLAAGGVADAHERIRRATLESEESGVELIEIVRRDAQLWETITDTCRALTGADAEYLLTHPEEYTGRAAARSRIVCETYSQRIDQIAERIG